MGNKTERNSLRQTLPKLLCFKKAAIPFKRAHRGALKSSNVKYLPEDYVKIFNVKEAEPPSSDARVSANVEKTENSDAVTTANSVAGKTENLSVRTDSSDSYQKRNSLHQDVEEALNSLLWQPYEYQNAGASRSLSSSSFGNPSTHDDLEQIPENDGTNGTSTTRCNFTDLHPPTSTSRMVINLRAAASHADQSVTHFSSRDPTTTIRSTVPIRQRQSAAFSWSEASVQCAYSDVNTGGDMQVNVTADAPATAPLVQVPDIGTTGDHGLRNRTSFFQDASLSSANVVGLPCHNRYASVPVTCGPSRPTTTHGLLPIHSRNISEPFNHSRSSSVPKCMPAVARQESGTTTTTTTVPSSSRFAQQVNNANVSNVNVNFYRAVPVNVVSSVPTIRCLNSSNNGQGNEVSNVQVLPLGSGYESHVSASSAGVTSCSVPSSSGGTVQVVTGCVPTIQIKGGEARTFTSTEAQTDEISVLPSSGEEDRERRRRERRDRRQQRRSAPVTPRAPEGDNFVGVGNPRLPDLLNSHQPPPYTTLGSGVLPPQAPLGLPPHQLAVLQTVVPNNVVPHSGFVFPGAPTGVVPGHHQVPMVQGVAPVAVPHADVGGFRFPFPVAGFSRGRFPEDHPKGCCGILSWKAGSLRWFIALIALVAVCCVLVGTALGAMRPSGRDHLTVSLLMIGVGIVLVTVSGVAWRLTSRSPPSCRSLLGLRGGGATPDPAPDTCPRRFAPRPPPPAFGRPHHPYAAMMYPEFRHRPPPPTYQASMQEYRLRLLLLDRGGAGEVGGVGMGVVSPPPTYRSHTGSLLRVPLSNRRDTCQSEYSCPPSYRSQNSMNRQGTAQSNSVLHSREHSLSISESDHGGSIVNIVNILGTACENGDTITLDSFKMEPDHDSNPVKMFLTGNNSDLEGSKSGNLVTIVQTNDRTPVIVTVSGNSQIGSSNSVQITEIPSEIEILAHL